MPKEKKCQMPRVHPGEVLREDLMKPLGLTVNGLARELKVLVNRLSEILNGRRALNADSALRLSRYFGNGSFFRQPTISASQLIPPQVEYNARCVPARQRERSPGSGNLMLV